MLRLDGKLYDYVSCDLSQFMNRYYCKMLNNVNYEIAYKMICRGGNRIRTKKRNLTMYQLGGTIGAAKFPCYMKPTSASRHMLPRPVVSCRPPFSTGFVFLSNNKWLQDFIQDIERLLIEFLKRKRTPMFQEILSHVMFSRHKLHSSLRICDTCFTSMIAVGDLKPNGNIPMHLDENDYVTALISIGTDNIVGGETVYYNGISEDALGSQILSVPYQHGRLQIGFYDHIYHGANPWINGQRGVINLSIQKNLLQHFYREGDHYYNQYIQAGYPSGDFVAT